MASELHVINEPYLKPCLGEQASKRLINLHVCLAKYFEAPLLTSEAQTMPSSHLSEVAGQPNAGLRKPK